jgi:hypothetical protein
MLYMEKDLRCCAGGGESRTSGAQRGREETCRKVTRLAPTQLECAIFLCKYLSSEALRQEIEEGLNVRFLSPFGDITLWNILISCVVLPYISLYARMTNQMLWGHILSVAPETASMEGEARFHLDTSHNRPDAFVT